MWFGTVSGGPGPAPEDDTLVIFPSGQCRAGTTTLAFPQTSVGLGSLCPNAAIVLR